MTGSRKAVRALLRASLLGAIVLSLAVASAQTLNVTLDQNIAVIDPTANWLYDLTANQFVPLVGYDSVTGQAEPAGAESWSVSDDGLTYTFNIRQGWNWSDGTPVTANDYVNSFRRIADPATAAPMAYRIYIIQGAQAVNQGETDDLSTIGVAAVDDHTLTVTITSPASWFLSSLASIGHAIPQWTIDAHGDAWTNPENVVVNGPYKLTRLVPEDIAVLEANPSYYDAENVQIKTVNLYTVPQESTALALYEDGMLDTVNVPASDLDRVKADPVLSAEYYNGPATVLYYYDFNAIRAPFDNVLVRQAFAQPESVASHVARVGHRHAGTGQGDRRPPGGGR